MARPLRIEFAVGLYHLASRGDRREDIYGLQRDGLLSAFAATEKEAVARYRRFVADGVGQPSPWDRVKH